MFTPDDVNLSRMMEELNALSHMGRTPAGGITRLTFSPPHLEATRFVADKMHAAGLDVYFDRWANLYGRTSAANGTPGGETSSSGEKAVLTGSHLDSVPNGGNFDGPLGVLTSLEAVRLIMERGVSLDRPLEVVSFIEEEGASYKGLMGSALATGEISEETAATITGADGLRFVDTLAQLDLPYPVRDVVHDGAQVDSYMELHIEQGKRLERAGIPVGIVSSIAGPSFLRVTLNGQADHAGATEYDDRRDTLLAAADIIQQIRLVAHSQFYDNGRMTVGKITAEPNVTNVVAARTIFNVDYRAGTTRALNDMTFALHQLVANVSSKHKVECDIRLLQSTPPFEVPHHITQAVAQAAQQAGLASQPLISWAAHDAMIVAKVAPSGMIFVPCRDGRSHTPEEHIDPAHIAAGAAAMANTLLQMANRS